MDVSRVRSRGSDPRRYPGSRISARPLPSSPERPWRAPPAGGGGPLPGHSCGHSPGFPPCSPRGAGTVADDPADPPLLSDERSAAVLWLGRRLGLRGRPAVRSGYVPAEGRVLILGGTTVPADLARALGHRPDLDCDLVRRPPLLRRPPPAGRHPGRRLRRHRRLGRLPPRRAPVDRRRRRHPPVRRPYAGTPPRLRDATGAPRGARPAAGLAAAAGLHGTAVLQRRRGRRRRRGLGSRRVFLTTGRQESCPLRPPGRRPLPRPSVEPPDPMPLPAQAAA